MLRSITKSSLASSNSILKSSILLNSFKSSCLIKRFLSSSSSLASNQSPPAQDVFLSSNNANYIDQMYSAWLADPSSVHISWNAYFKNLDSGLPASKAFQTPPNLFPLGSGNIGVANITPPTDKPMNEDVITHLKVQLLCRAYEVRGHQAANLDPLNISFGTHNKPAELNLDYYGFTENDLDKLITLGPGILPRFSNNSNKGQMKLRDIISSLESLYCNSYGLEYIHISSREQCDWLRERIQVPTPFHYSNDQKRQILDRLIWATSFESFLSTKFPNDKRFGLEGEESVVVGMKSLIDKAVTFGAEDVVIGMAHRGRLNVLSNVVRKPNESIFSEFTGSKKDDEGSGDVKYHLGMNYQRPTVSGKHVNLSVVANPSHLEAEDPVVLGRTRAIQHYKNDIGTFNKALGVLCHGDSAFAGQGVVYESIGLTALPAYTTGGTIHIIINNQIGFTTDPRFARSTPYPSDLAKSINAPIFHVNADDVESVVFICDLATEWRSTFHTDVIIDVVGYRKHGHNETDQPFFTQPKMYEAIAKKESVIDIYCKKLIKDGTFTQEDIDEHKKWVWGLLEDSFARSKEYKPTAREWLTTPWEGFKSPKELAEEILPHFPTGLPTETLKHIGNTISSWPEGFEVHGNLKRILKNRKKSLDTGEGIDWSTGEALAFGSLLLEGYHVRVSGQDVERGTFSQRHAVLHDQKTEKTYTPLKNLDEKQADFVISNSSLSEYGVMGFEYGYSLTSPDALVVWEAQFGDFANTAQVIVDQFISSAESKWKQRSGIVLSLPHGYDGQGPEHSSGRLERYLQMCSEDSRHFPSPKKLERQHQDCNMQVIYPTTPANIFHALRRNMHRQFRKPLIIFFSKNLLRHKLARSKIDEFLEGSSFKLIIEEEVPNKQDIKRVVLSSGQVYAQLYAKREALKNTNTTFIKVEQINPFPFAQLRDAFDSYPALEEIVWCQEEPLNMGAWSFVSPRLNTTLAETQNYKSFKIRYCGRDPSASVAAGSKKMHIAEEEAFLNDVFNTSN
ncbi:alpha-ketoglutarate dehydrogenase KGD1 [Ascoidea rubescens DSM 1968]|uniref:2-oxoglutarate dehydrogenase, mitochondrial n=1 Tax=Ascoidea rubescens DSM 1968 TaxID=1344418 RepID=A0A1D2VK26_9ASCO|nr:2-oxoglutarate dehydrogenase, E1 component [Ascoidea rubescens DSM 1968]ODV61954.1 2-oxoglutarate dehydrogenase, E1 component [Ascoidea rubescens DSM 1968]